MPTPVTGTGVVTPALICLCCVLGRWSTLSPVWWCCTGLGEAQGVLEVAARDITGATRTAFDGEGPGPGSGQLQAWGCWAWQTGGLGGCGEQEGGVALLLGKPGEAAWVVLRDPPPSLEHPLPHLAWPSTLMVFASPQDRQLEWTRMGR